MFYICDRVDWEEATVKTSPNVKQSKRSIVNSSDLDLTESSSINILEMVSEKRQTFLVIYACIITLGAFCYLGRSFSFYQMCINISINLHDMIFRGVTRARMIFFNDNPSGRILNRFARDIDSVDSLLPIIMVDVFDVSCPSESYNLVVQCSN